MKRLYIGSLNSRSGKTMLSLGLCLILREMGIDIGLVKPIGKNPVSKRGKVIDEVAVLFKELLSLEAPLQEICPLIRGYDSLDRELKAKTATLKKRVIGALESQQDRELQVISGSDSLTEGASLGIDMREIISITGASLLLIERWHREESIDALCFAKEFFGQAFIGVVLNMVREEEIKYIKEKVVPYLKKRGIRVFGILPYYPTLAAPTVAQLSRLLGGRVLCCEEALEELVENYMVGAMDVDEAMKYFKKTPNKAVITGAHRSDIQLAALETSTRCIILTGGLQPNDVIIGKAKLKGVPIVSVRYDTFTVVDRIERFYGRASIGHPEKIKLIEDIIRKQVDVKGILKGLGLKR